MQVYINSHFEYSPLELFSYLSLRCVCFRWKSLPEMLFWKCGCLVGPENRIFRKLISVDRKKKALTTEIILHFHFHFKVFLEKERERERERARERKKTELQSDDRTVPLNLASARSHLLLRRAISIWPDLMNFFAGFCFFFLWMNVELIHYPHVYSWGSVWKIGWLGYVKHFL